jgi:hypothetical protein
MPDWDVALVGATALHAGFQLTVTVVVYPALAASGREAPGSWTQVHGLHSRRIAPLVAVVYGAALVACVGTVLSGPSYAGWLAVGGTAAALAVTAARAAPLHGRLERGPDPALLRSLIVADRLRLLAALVALVAAVLALG